MSEHHVPPGDGSPAAPTTSFGPPTPPAPDEPRGFWAAVRRLGVQRTDDRWVGGVCAGIADRFGIDPLVVRGILAVTLLLGGAGAVVYGLAWALLPERRDGRIHLEETVAGRFDAAIVGAAALVVLGLGRGGNAWWAFGAPGQAWLGHVFDAFAGILWLAVVVGAVLGVVWLTRRERPAGPDQAGRPARPTSPYPAPGTPPHQPATPYGTAPWASAPSPTTYASTASAATSAAPVQDLPTTDPAGSWTPTPARARRRGPGAPTVGTVVALALIVSAVLLATARTDAFGGPVLLTALGATAVLCGIGIVVSGVRGRSSGVLGFLAIVALLVALPVGATEGRIGPWGTSSTAPTTRADAERGVDVGAGQATVDLTGIPLTTDTLVVPVRVGAGDVTVVVPADAAVEATVTIGAGAVTWAVDEPSTQTSGVGVDRTFRDEASRDGTPQLSLDLSIGFGDVTVTREDS